MDLGIYIYIYIPVRTSPLHSHLNLHDSMRMGLTILFLGLTNSLGQDTRFHFSGRFLQVSFFKRAMRDILQRKLEDVFFSSGSV